jgi:hypothetical protein
MKKASLFGKKNKKNKRRLELSINNNNKSFTDVKEVDSSSKQVK